ncbi:MAG TPA: response regulator transcription factor [Bacteroidales bacterium]|nr:response regulator transcription factor [Bacteroidales bacterium]
MKLIGGEDMPPTNVILADDHPIVRAGIRNLLEQAPDIVVIGEASDGKEALRMVEELKPDVLLLDMEMPGISGAEVAHELMASGSTVHILALSAHDDKEYIQELLANGASGYLVKEEVPNAIVEAVRGVSRGERGWLSRRIAAQMSAWMQEGEQDRKGLTTREVEVLQAVVAGKTNQEIGLALGISEKTVEKHLEGVFSKLQVASRVEAAVRAVREGWL